MRTLRRLRFLATAIPVAAGAGLSVRVVEQGWGLVRRVIRHGVLLGAACLATGVPASERADLEAAIVYNILPFVEWPADAAPVGGGPLVLCVEPGSRLAVPLRALQGRPLRSHRLEVADLPTADLLRRCHAVFLDAGGRAATGVHRRALRGLPVLVFGDEGDVDDDVVAVRLVQADSRVGFEIDMGAVRPSRLQINSRLLRLARRVGE